MKRSQSGSAWQSFVHEMIDGSFPERLPMQSAQPGDDAFCGLGQTSPGPLQASWQGAVSAQPQEASSIAK